MTSTLNPGVILNPAAVTGEFVLKKVAGLQEGYLHHPRPLPRAVAALARLRRGVGKSPARCPDLAEFFIIPELPDNGDDPTRAEWAAHVATGLYAMHQQSVDERMNVVGRDFGTACGMLWRRDGENPGVLRRFQALGTAIDLAETTQHARGLVQLLRAEKLGFDYGRFAADLLRFQDPARRDAVRLRWGRGFYGYVPKPDAPSTQGGTIGHPVSPVGDPTF